MAEYFPAIKLWQDVAFALVVTACFHGAVLPLGGWTPPV
ncbi:hypothetical protein [Pantoea agglomerans]